MKKYSSLGLATFLAAGSALAVNPVQCWYGGIQGEVSYIPTINSVYHAVPVASVPQISTVTINDKIAYRIMGGGGGQLGYRFMDNYRAEASILYNINYYDHVVINGFDIPYAAKSADPIPGLTEKGSTSFISGFLNMYYDFFTPGNDTYFVPHVGLGLGILRMSNQIVFYQDSIEIANARANVISNVPAAQAIIGASYFLDDYTYIGLDYRYLTTRNIEVFNNSYVAHMLNFNINFAFDTSKS